MSAPVTRRTARVLPINNKGQVLLLLGHDPARPESPYWFAIGGGVEGNETLEQAAVRELLEETGIKVGAHELTGPFYRGTHSYSFNGVAAVSDSTFFAVQVGDVSVTFQGLGDGEIGNIFSADWWSPDALGLGSLSNDHLPQIARRAVAALANRTR